MSSDKLGKRRASISGWKVSDTENVNDSVEAKKARNDSELIQLDCNVTVTEQVNEIAAKITNRRRSLRLSNKTLQLSNNKNTNKNSSSVRRTTTIQSTAAALQTNPSTEATTSTAQNKKKVVKVRTRCDLSESISSCFNDKIPDPSNPKRYSAKCTLCDINEPRKFFWIGNNSNLKSHISRVNTTIKIVQFRMEIVYLFICYLFSPFERLFHFFSIFRCTQTFTSVLSLNPKRKKRQSKQWHKIQSSVIL